MKEYIPTALRQRPITAREVRYGVGFDRGKEGFAGINGPYASEEEALENLGVADAVIMRFNADDTNEIIWRWKIDRWVSAS